MLCIVQCSLPVLSAVVLCLGLRKDIVRNLEVTMRWAMEAGSRNRVNSGLLRAKPASCFAPRSSSSNNSPICCRVPAGNHQVAWRRDHLQPCREVGVSPTTACSCANPRRLGRRRRPSRLRSRHVLGAWQVQRRGDRLRRSSAIRNGPPARRRPHGSPIFLAKPSNPATSVGAARVVLAMEVKIARGSSQAARRH